MDEVGRDIYEFLQQFFQLFPEYQSNEFYTFGESYGGKALAFSKITTINIILIIIISVCLGKYVPAVSAKIIEENDIGLGIPINYAGLGLGNPITHPYDSCIYADFLYQVHIGMY